MGFYYAQELLIIDPSTMHFNWYLKFFVNRGIMEFFITCALPIYPFRYYNSKDQANVTVILFRYRVTTTVFLCATIPVYLIQHQFIRIWHSYVLWKFSFTIKIGEWLARGSIIIEKGILKINAYVLDSNPFCTCIHQRNAFCIHPLLSFYPHDMLSFVITVKIIFILT